MKLLFFIEDLKGGGAERVMVTLLNSLSQKGNNCTLVRTSDDSIIAYPINKDVAIVDLSKNAPKFRKSIFNKIHRWSWYFLSIRKIANRIKPDAVVSFQAALNNDVIFSLLGTRHPVIVSEHTNVTRKKIGRKNTVFYRKLLYPFATAITVLTRRDYKLWKEKYPQVVYMPNPIDLGILEPVSDKKKVVLAVGEVNRWQIKGFDLLIRAWGAICTSFPEWELQIAGNYSDSARIFLDSIIDEVGAERIQFLGFRKDVKALMANSEVYCLSSRVEGLPMGLIEAMSLGCCCVAFNCVTGPNEIIKDGKSGLLAEAENYQELADKLRMVLSDSALRTELSSNTRESIEKYSTQRIIKRWEILLEKVVAKS